MKKILIDLDVVTVAFWNRHKEALEFLARLKSGEFELETGVKEEDAVLVVVTSLFSLGYLVTYNRKHLRDKVGVINRVLSKNGFREIKISSPSEF